MLEHGELALEWQGDVLILRPQGAFNEEGTMAAFTLFRQFVLDSNKPAWLRLEVWGDTLGVPESMAQLPSIYTWAESHGCKATAIVITNYVQERIVRSHITSSSVFDVFRNEVDALAWLSTLSK